MVKFWIQKAVKHAGALKRFAKKHHALNEDGTINLEKVKRAAERIKNHEERLKRIRQVNLARVLRKLRRA